MAGGSAPSRWASSCLLSLSSILQPSGQLPVALPALAVVLHQVPSRGWRMGFPWPFSSSGSAHLHLPPPSSSSFSYSPPSVSSPWAALKSWARVRCPGLFALYCFLFFSSGQIRRAGLPSSLLGDPLQHGPFSFPFLFLGVSLFEDPPSQPGHLLPARPRQTAFRPDTSLHSPAKSCIS